MFFEGLNHSIHNVFSKKKKATTFNFLHAGIFQFVQKYVTFLAAMNDNLETPQNHRFLSSCKGSFQAL